MIAMPWATPNFNPPSPCGEGPLAVNPRSAWTLFQSTLPVWGGTTFLPAVLQSIQISIHPPRVGRDLAEISRNTWMMDFNPPSPCGEGRTTVHGFIKISRYFNPPSPCGEGLQNSIGQLGADIFQSTLPVWGGTQQHKAALVYIDISIHPPRVGRDDR